MSDMSSSDPRTFLASSAAASAIHVRPKHDNALPVIITHGWPGSLDFRHIAALH
jgi:hypothetical protein